MRVYFLSEKQSGLTVGGLYVGLVDGFERSLELDPAAELFCELKPCGPFLPLSFRFDEGFLHDPPPPIVLYYSGNAVAVYASGFLPADASLKVCAQKRFGGTLLTLLRQGKLQLSLENETGFHLIDLNDALDPCEILPMPGGFLLKGEGAFAHISHAGKLLLFSEGNVLSAEETLRAEVPFHDSRGHTALMEWKEGTLLSCTIRTPAEPTETTFALALFESALIGADVRPFLADTLAEKADRLKEFLGDYRSVVLTPRPDTVGLVYERRERIFDVRYFRIELEEEKVKNIYPL